MRKFALCLVLICIGFFAYAQAPQAFKYQAVARDMNGDPVINQDIAVKISILSGSPSGALVYSELHEIPTSEFGLFSLEIGNATFVFSGNFSEIGWGNSTHFLKTEIDINGGSNYQLMGVSQLLSVPYALYANEAGNAQNYTGGTGINVSNEVISNTAPDKTVTIASGTGISTTGTYPNFNITNTQPNATHTGDASGNGELTVLKIQGRNVSNNAPANGQVLKWNNAALAWQPTNEENTTSSIKDTDSDTKIQTEKNQDEDIIRFDLGGTERWVMNGSRLESKNSGFSVFIGDSAGYSDDLQSNFNVFIGEGAGRTNSWGFYNSAVGNQAFYLNTSGYHNSAFGNNSMFSNQTGISNAAFGSVSLFENQTGNDNTAIGTSSLNKNTSGDYNTAVGSLSGVNVTTGNNNILLGYNAGGNITTGSRNIIIGTFMSAPVSTGDNQLVIGHPNLLYGDILNKYIGLGTTTPHAPLQFANSIVNRKIVLYETQDNDHEFYGFGISSAILRYQVSNTAKDHVFYAGTSSSTSDELMRIKGNGNVGIGVNPDYKLAIGGTLGILETGTSPTYYSIFQGGNQTANLTYTLPIAYGTTGQVLSTSSAGVLSWTSTPAINILKDNDGDTKIQVEENADEDIIRFDIAGSEKWIMKGSRLEPKSSNDNLCIGENVMYKSNTTGVTNTFIGNRSGYANISGDYNLGVGNNTLNSNLAGVENIAIGLNACLNTTGSYNLAIGINALYNNKANLRSTAIGYDAMFNADSSSNAGIATFNTAIGYEAMRGSNTIANNTGQYNTGIGDNALRSISSGQKNTVAGKHAGYAVTTGSNNVLYGFYAGSNITTGSNNIIIGYNINAPVATGSNQLVLGAPDLFYGDIANKFIGLGTTTPHAPLQFENNIVNRKIVLFETEDNDHEFYGFGISTAILRYQVSATSKAHVFYAATSATTSDELMRISGNGNVKINNLTTNGTVYSNNGVLTNVNPSDKSLKENINPFSSTLPLIMKLNPVTFDWKEDQSKGIGFIAQEMEEVIPELVGTNIDGTKGIYTVEMIPYLVKALQEQQQLIEEMKLQQKNMQEKIETLENSK